MKSQVDAVLLAGGLSTRYGQPKATVSWRGRTLSEHVLAALPDQTGKTILVLRNPSDPIPITTDLLTHDNPSAPEGPLRGLIAGLECCETELAWCLACDIPGVIPDVLEQLVAHYQPGDVAVVPVWQGHLQPTCALYSVAALPALIKASAGGVHSLQGALRSLDFREMSEETVRKIDPHGFSFHNVNRPEDLISLEKSFSATSQKQEQTND